MKHASEGRHAVKQHLPGMAGAGWTAVWRWVGPRVGGLGEGLFSLLLSVAIAGLTFGAACGAPDVVARRASLAAGGSSPGGFSASSGGGTGGVAGFAAPPGAGGTGSGGAGASGTGGIGYAGGSGGLNPFGAGGGATGGAGGTTVVSSDGASGGAGGSSSSTSSSAPPVDGLQVWVIKKPTGNTGQIGLSVRIDNQTTQSVDMSTVTLRYWYQDEGLSTALVLASNYVSVGYSGQGKVTSGTAVANPSPVAGADHYLELSFAATLSAQGNAATNDEFTVQVNLHTAGYTGVVDVTNDYSYDGGAEGVYEKKITLHDKSGNVIWGTPPGDQGSLGDTGAGADASVSDGDSGV